MRRRSKSGSFDVLGRILDGGVRLSNSQHHSSIMEAKLFECRDQIGSLHIAV
jgi:hypothetical protein